VSDLDRQVAEALGLNLATHFNFVPEQGVTYLATGKSYPDPVAVKFCPSTNWEQYGKLIKEYKISVYWSSRYNCWKGFELGTNTGAATGATPQEAVCRTVIAMKEGQ